LTEIGEREKRRRGGRKDERNEKEDRTRDTKQRSKFTSESLRSHHRDLQGGGGGGGGDEDDDDDDDDDDVALTTSSRSARDPREFAPSAVSRWSSSASGRAISFRETARIESLDEMTSNCRARSPDFVIPLDLPQPRKKDAE